MIALPGNRRAQASGRRRPSRLTAAEPPTTASAPVHLSTPIRSGAISPGTKAAPILTVATVNSGVRARMALTREASLMGQGFRQTHRRRQWY